MIYDTLTVIGSDISKYHRGLDSVLDMYLDLGFSDVEWYIPDGEAPATPFENQRDSLTNLNSEFRRMYIFHADKDGKDPYPTIGNTKREGLYLDLLNGLSKIECDFLQAVRNGLKNHEMWKNINN